MQDGFMNDRTEGKFNLPKNITTEKTTKSTISLD